MGQDPEEKLTAERRLVWDKTHLNSPASKGVDEHLAVFLRFLSSQLPTGEAILDAGSGKGRHLSLLEEMDYSVWGCDLSEAAVSKVRGSETDAIYRGQITVADLRSLPYRNSIYSAAICIHTLPYNRLSEIERIVSELERVISPGGWLYADFLDLADREYGSGEELEENTFCDDIGLPIHFSGEKEIRVLLERFDIMRLEKNILGTKPRFRIAWTVWAQRSI